MAAADRTVLASTDEDLVGTRVSVGESTVLTGRSWSGEGSWDGRPAAIAMVPTLALDGETIGFAVV